ncbi:MAG TPA: DapH/DapD/GlmU-related protein [Chitinophagaceae bacterium]|nr:DapH/DapD/GlmU-related protein [Chitinophagaceae bacterium]
MRLSDIISRIRHLEFIGNIEQDITEVIALDGSNARNDVICWCSDKNVEALAGLKHGTIICSVAARPFVQKGCNYIITSNPRDSFRQLLELFNPVESGVDVIAASAVIHPSVQLGKQVQIGNNVVIEKDCVIGNNTSIGHNTVIYSRCVIGNNVKIGANNTIGGVGFGYELNDEKKYVVIPHLGNVVIEDNVEIGNNTCIDRAVLGSTILRNNVKVDNLVHIAHGVSIDENSLIIANAMIGGSTRIGKNCWVAPSASLLNKIELGEACVVGMGAVVLKDVPRKQTVVGNPGKPLTD